MKNDVPNWSHKSLEFQIQLSKRLTASPASLSPSCYFWRDLAKILFHTVLLDAPLQEWHHRCKTLSSNGDGQGVLWVVVLTNLRNERYFNDMRSWNSQEENPLSPSHHRRHTPCFSPAPMSTTVPSVFPHARAPSSALLSNVALLRSPQRHQYCNQFIGSFYDNTKNKMR